MTRAALVHIILKPIRELLVIADDILDVLFFLYWAPRCNITDVAGTDIKGCCVLFISVLIVFFDTCRVDACIRQEVGRMDTIGPHIYISSTTLYVMHPDKCLFNCHQRLPAERGLFPRRSYFMTWFRHFWRLLWLKVTFPVVSGRCMIGNGSDFHCSKERTSTIISLSLGGCCRVDSNSIRHHTHISLEQRTSHLRYRPLGWCWADIVTGRKVVFVPQTSPRNGQVFEASRLNISHFFFLFSRWHKCVNKVLIPN